MIPPRKAVVCPHCHTTPDLKMHMSMKDVRQGLQTLNDSFVATPSLHLFSCGSSVVIIRRQALEHEEKTNTSCGCTVDCILFTTEHVSSRLESCENPKQPLNLQTAPSHLRAPTRGLGKPLAKKLTQTAIFALLTRVL